MFAPRRAAARGRPLHNRWASLALAAALAIPTAGQAAVRSWTGGDGWFFDPWAWAPGGAPQSDDTAYIGNLAAAAGATVSMGGEWGFSYGALHLAGGATLDTNGSELVSFGVATISGNGTRLIARPAPYLNQSDLQGQIRIGEGAHLELRDNVYATFFNSSYNDGTISGRGLIVSAAGFENNGTLLPGNNGGLVFNAGQLEQTLVVDLDGGQGSGRLSLTTPFSRLQVNAGSLMDPFSGQVSMVHGSLLDMQVGNGWAADSNSRIVVLGFDNAAASQITGSHFSFAGELSVDLAEGKLRVLAPMTVQANARVEVGHTDQLVFQGNTTVQGGSFTLGRFGTLRFDGPTTLSGGSFASFSQSYDDGTVAFNGPTTWNGVVTLAGTARQQGTASVSGWSGATIHAERFDMDGLSGTTTWNVNAPLNLHAQQIGTTASNRFAGTLNIGGGFAPRLTLQLADPGASWILSGTLNLSGLTGQVETKVAGSRMLVQGQLNVSGGRVRIDADTRFSATGFAGPATVTFAAAAAELWMGGQTEVDAGVQFEGAGILRNALGGSLVLADGASLAQVGLINAGQLAIGAGAGTAATPAFTQVASGVWTVDLGGAAPGTEHDLLTVFGGGAVLGGSLQVALIDLGGGAFHPEVGDAFTILLAPAGVSGTFENTPVTMADGWIYQWDVRYGSDDVRLQLAGVTAVPEPGAWALLLAGLAATGSVVRRRRAARG